MLLQAPALPQLLQVAVHGAQSICREAQQQLQGKANSFSTKRRPRIKNCLLAYRGGGREGRQRASKTVVSKAGNKRSDGIALSPWKPSRIQAPFGCTVLGSGDPACDILPSVVPPPILPFPPLAEL